MLSYPDGLPLPLRDGYSLKPVSPIIGTTMASGRSMTRRRFRSVPTYPSVTWLFSEAEARLFDGWVEHAIGFADWFLMPLRTPMGLAPAKVKFTEEFIGGKELVGVNYWRYTATLEAFELPVITEAELTDLLAGMDLSVMNAQLRALLRRWYTQSWI